MGDSLGGAGQIIGGLGGLAGGIGGIVAGSGADSAAANSASAINSAMLAQLAAAKEQRAFVYANLDPSKINSEAAKADTQRALARLALQGQIDPKLLDARYAAEDQIAKQLSEIGGASSDAVASQTTKEALKGVPGLDAVKAGLVDAAAKELAAGATLPPDVQAELVKAGLEQSGMVTGSASPRGVGGTMLRTLLGSAGVNLQMARQKQASDLAASASNLEAQRQNILQGLFPKLQNQQMQNIAATSGILNQSNSMAPQAGLSGSDVANIWLARVGATNQLTQQAANAYSSGIVGMANAQNAGAGANAGFNASMFGSIPYLANSLSSVGNGISGWLTPGTGNGASAW